MATGDIKNNLRKLMVELKQVRYPVTQVDLKGLGQGTPRSCLPILHYVFLDYSIDLTEFFAKDFEMYSKTDLRFVETVYKLLRDVFHYKPPLTREQFLSIGYAERKIIELCDILKMCREKNSELNPKTSKPEKRHSHSKGKTNITDVGKEVEKTTSKVINFSEKRGQKLSRSSQNEILTKKENKMEKDQEQNSIHLQFHQQDINKHVISHTQTLGQKGVLKSGVKSVRWKEDDGESIVTSTLIRGPPKNIPVPVTMTTIPKPSPELTLTPIGKTIHQPIPLSGPRHDLGDVTNVSLIDLTDSMNVQQPKVVRHEYDKELETRASSSMNNQDILLTLSQDKEFKLLKGTIQELQEKLDFVLSQNNEMSARVVLLESRVKLLEEAPSKSQCEKCRNTDYSLPNYNVSTNPFSSHIPAHVQREYGTTTTAMTAHPQLEDKSDYASGQTVSSNRNLINEFNYSQNSSAFQNTVDNRYASERHDYRSLHNVDVPNRVSTVTVISDDEEEIDNNTSSTACPDGSPMSCTPSKSTCASLEAISPFSTTQEIHLKFSDPSTTATILNVERRLKETRKMLANASRFVAPSI